MEHNITNFKFAKGKVCGGLFYSTGDGAETTRSPITIQLQNQASFSNCHIVWVFEGRSAQTSLKCQEIKTVPCTLISTKYKELILVAQDVAILTRFAFLNSNKRNNK